MPLRNYVAQRHFLYEQDQKGTISEYIKYNSNSTIRVYETTLGNK